MAGSHPGTVGGAFFESVEAAFAFLVDEYGFGPPTRAEVSGGQLRTVEFRSARAWVRVSHARYLELDVRVGLGGPGETAAVPLGAVVESQDSDYSLAADHASAPAAIRVCVTRLAEALRRFGAGVLRGDAEAFRRAREAEEHRESQWRRAEVLAEARRDAEAARRSPCPTLGQGTRES